MIGRLVKERSDTHCDREVSEREDLDTHCDREVSEREEWTLTVIGRLVKERSGHSL